jgi:hypothetical protein
MMCEIWRDGLGLEEVLLGYREMFLGDRTFPSCSVVSASSARRA